MRGARRRLRAPAESDGFARLLRRWAIGVVLAAIATELLPVVFGTGDKAVWDWSFTYVTARFVLLPVFCVVHLVLVVVFVVVGRRRRAGASWLPVASALASAGYLLGHWLYPLPWFVAGAP